MAVVSNLSTLQKTLMVKLYWNCCWNVAQRWFFKSSMAINRSRTRQNFELVHIIGPVQNFGPPARNFGPLRAEFAWREWRKTLGGHVANWAGLSGFSPRENKIFHTFFIDCINKYSKVSNAHNSDDCHGVRVGVNSIFSIQFQFRYFQFQFQFHYSQ